MTERNIDQAALKSNQQHSFLAGEQMDFIRPHSPLGLSDYDYEESFSEKSRKAEVTSLHPNSSGKTIDLQKAMPLHHISATEKCFMDQMNVKNPTLQPLYGTTQVGSWSNNSAIEAINRKDSLFEDYVEFPMIADDGLEGIFEVNERDPSNLTPQFEHNNLFGIDNTSKPPFATSSAFLQNHQASPLQHPSFNHKINTPSNLSKQEEEKCAVSQGGQTTSKACSDQVSISASSDINETGLNKYSKIYEDERKPKILINDPNDPIYQRREYEEKNREYYLKFTQALKVAKSKGECLQGKVFDRVSGNFKQASILNDEELKQKAIDHTFFLKNGSIFSRMDTEMELLNLKLKEKQYLTKQSKGGKNSIYASTLICKESKCKSDKDFILPGLFSTGTASPIKMVPKKPISTAKSVKEVENESPDLAILGPNGQPISQYDTFHEQKKQRLLQPFELYHESNFIEIDSDQLSLIKLQKDNAIIPIDNPTKILPKSNASYHDFKRPLSCLTKNNINDDDDDDLFAPVQRKMRQQSNIQAQIDAAADKRENKEEMKIANDKQISDLPIPKPLKIISSSTLMYNQEKHNPLFHVEKLTPAIKDLSIVESFASKKSSKVSSPNKENIGSKRKTDDVSQPINHFQRKAAQQKENSFIRKSYNT